MELRISQAKAIVQRHTIWAMGSAFITIPFMDVFVVTGAQLDMMKKLGDLYEVDYSVSYGRSIATTLSGSTLARLGSSVIKMIPGIGPILGGFPMSILSGAMTYSLGHVVINHLENGGNFENLNPLDYKNLYEEKYEEGKTKARQWQDTAEEEAKAADKDSRNSRLQKLKELRRLAELHEQGILSEEEYQRMKARIVDNF